MAAPNQLAGLQELKTESSERDSGDPSCDDSSSGKAYESFIERFVILQSHLNNESTTEIHSAMIRLEEFDGLYLDALACLISRCSGENRDAQVPIGPRAPFNLLCWSKLRLFANYKRYRSRFFEPNDLANYAYTKFSTRLNSKKPVTFRAISEVYRYLNAIVKSCFNDQTLKSGRMPTVKNEILNASRPLSGGRPKKRPS
jgi:hypothetical protein